MKLKHIAPSHLALAMALTCGAVSAGEITNDKVRVHWAQPYENVAHIAEAATPAIAAAKTPKEKGEALATALREAGVLSATVSVQDNGDLIVSMAKPVFTGDYSEYFKQSKVLTKRQLEAGAVKASNRGKADGKAVRIDVGNIDQETGTITVSTTAVDVKEWKNWAVGAGVNNYGSRYSGSDLATIYGRVALEDGNEVSGSFAHGFSNSTPDSYGGRYNAASVAWSHHGRHGTTKTQFTNALWTAGGPVRVFDLTGRVTTLSVGHWVPLSSSWTVFGEITRTENRQHMGVVGWKDQTNYTTVRAGAEYRTSSSVAAVAIEKGLGGSRDFNAVPLIGTFDPNYTALKADWAAHRNLNDDGWVLKGGLGGHIASSDTPSNELFSAGGPGRGRAWLTGSSSGKRGVYGEVVVEAPERQGFTPYAGIDTAIVDRQAGGSQHLSSAFVGTRYNHGRFNLDAGYAHGIGSNDLAGQQKDSRLFLSAGVSW